MVMDILTKSINERLLQVNNNYLKLKPGKYIRGCSIIIPVYNQLSELKITLNHLLKQKIKLNYEIIVIDDHSNKINNVKLLEEEYLKNKHIRIYRNKKNLGVAASRNIGISNARYNLLIFLDADMVVPKSFIRNHVKLHKSKNKIIVVGFRKHKLYKINKEYNFKYPASYKSDFRYHRFIPKNWKNIYTNQSLEIFNKHYYILNQTNSFLNFGKDIKIGVWTLPHMVVGSNISIRKEFVVKVGGFDTKFKRSWYEDTHFGAKLIASGIKVIPLKNVTCYHLIRNKKNINISKEIAIKNNRKLYNKLLNLSLKESCKGNNIYHYKINKSKYYDTIN